MLGIGDHNTDLHAILVPLRKPAAPHRVSPQGHTPSMSATGAAHSAAALIRSVAACAVLLAAMESWPGSLLVRAQSPAFPGICPLSAQA
jgi:hypothetical protein